MCWLLDELQAECVRPGGEMLKLKTCALLFLLYTCFICVYLLNQFCILVKVNNSGPFPCRVFLRVGLQVSKNLDCYFFSIIELK